ncbi:hypothetical protein [Chryseobacterium vrystaatense]|uniref:Uncharacterized protein n=1 Tax=Chryseobacterium vrystaatense TaxID=307480 RepID=A0ABR4UI35_9FLAO|nr:hypothetical protein [Chryseobacterium vrystaatense]KFF24319.1 hypothetical protein IW16_20830 [Chryseobacterium vrystaatense]
MKNIFKIFSITILFLTSTKINAQLDTLSYLKQFEDNKSQYINKPMSYLLGNMAQIQPKTIWPVPVTNKKSVIRESRLKFSDLGYSNTITMRITWQEEIPYSQVDYYQKKNNFYFTTDERVFYGSKIVKDIMVYR